MTIGDQLRATTELNRKDFDQLLQDFESVYQAQIEQNSETRIRKIGGGRKGKLKTNQEKLFYILFYYKCYPTFDLAAVLFDCDRSQAHRWVHRLQPILELGQNIILVMKIKLCL